MKRRFSVIIATYNYEKYVKRAIDSVLSQTFQDYEVIVVDDGSTDRTSEALKSYGEKIRAIRQVNQGSEMAYKTGASFAIGEYLVFLDSDDLFLPWTLATYDDIIQNFCLPPVIIGSMFYFSDEGDIQGIVRNVDAIKVLKYRDYLSKGISIGLSQSRIIIQKSIFDEANILMEKVTEPFLLNDYNLMLIAGTYGPCIIIQQPITVAYRQHSAQGSKKVEKMAKGVLALINALTTGPYSQSSRRTSKYAYVGGLVFEWSGKALKTHQQGLALRLLIKGAPMLAAAVAKKIWNTLFWRSSPITIKVERANLS